MATTVPFSYFLFNHNCILVYLPKVLLKVSYFHFLKYCIHCISTHMLCLQSCRKNVFFELVWYSLQFLSPTVHHLMSNEIFYLTFLAKKFHKLLTKLHVLHKTMRYSDLPLLISFQMLQH